jgi:hypothetical protein
LCNVLSLQAYPSTQAVFTGRIYYSTDSLQQLSYKEFRVSLLDFQSSLSPDMQIIADKASELLASLSVTTGMYENFSLLLRQLKDGLLALQL